MSRFFIAVISCSILIVCIAQQTVPIQHKEDYRKVYATADKLYSDAEMLSGTKGFSDKDEEAMNRKALTEFKRTTTILKSGGEKNDSLAFFCYLKTGILEHYFGNIPEAKIAYTNCIQAKAGLPDLADSFLFKPYLYAGSIYYLQDNFDSAFQFYKKAEHIVNLYPVLLTETERLYNTFGSIYISTGNYKQAKNYFERAISILSPSHPYYNALLVNYKINIAGALIQLEEYKQADSIYQNVLSSGINTNETNHNIGLINLYTGKYLESISYFRKTSYDGSQQVALNNSMARAFLNLGQNDSASLYFQKALIANTHFNGLQKNSDHGNTFKLTADLFFSQKNYKQAILNYQQAIIQFDAAFENNNPENNPQSYSGVFSYIDLFNALTAKGNAYRQIYNSGKKNNDLLAALNAYRSAYLLISYVEKTYDSDEARLFLNKNKYSVRAVPIEISLELYDITKNKIYLEEAYLFDQRNKASILALNVQENILKRKNEGNTDIFSRQAAIKSTITRLSLKAAQGADSSQLINLNATIRDNEIILSKIQDTINTSPSFSGYRATEKIPAIAEIQNKILDKNTALLSYHLTPNRLFIFCITPGSFGYEKQIIDSNFFSSIREFIISLHEVSGEMKFNGSAGAEKLYKLLLAPFQNKLSDISRLIIIPDNDLNYLPFEALVDEKKKYLINNYAVQYQYSTALIGQLAEKKKSENIILGVGPFANASYTDTVNQVTFNQLNYSLAEIQKLKGKIILDKDATKSSFLQNAKHYTTIHLATHASVNDRFPERSFIAFYPGSPDYLLYAQEIYNLNLDSTKLIILSACETGSGQLVKGEGMMSLSRAFAYAGCSNIITSLWKAEDKTTAFLTSQLHIYLNKGYTRDKALQQAKIDLLNSDEIEQRFKTPNYWAHLVLIDEYEANKQNKILWWVFAGFLLVVITAFAFLYKKKNLAP